MLSVGIHSTNDNKTTAKTVYTCAVSFFRDVIIKWSRWFFQFESIVVFKLSLLKVIQKIHISFASGFYLMALPLLLALLPPTLPITTTKTTTSSLFLFCLILQLASVQQHCFLAVDARSLTIARTKNTRKKEEKPKTPTFRLAKWTSKHIRVVIGRSDGRQKVIGDSL